MFMSSKKAALVTGGATGIGRSAVLALARAGYDVAINYASQRGRGARNRGAGREVRREDPAREVRRQRRGRACAPWLQQIEKAFGRLDVLINNAGTTATWKPQDLETLSLDEWDRVFAVNVRGLFQVTRACVPLLKEAEGLRGQHRQHRRPAPRAAAPALRRQQGGGGEPDQDAGLEPRPRDPRQRRRARLDGRRLDAAHAGGQVRRPDGQARQGHAAQARGHRRRRRRDHDDAWSSPTASSPAKSS